VPKSTIASLLRLKSVNDSLHGDDQRSSEGASREASMLLEILQRRNKEKSVMSLDGLSLLFAFL
jgi:hypothetical protein